MKKEKKFETFYSFGDVAELQNFLRTKEWGSGELDYITVRGVVYTMHEYDMDGQQMSWANKKNDTLIECQTANRYKQGFKDAVVEAYPDYGLLRDDINYQE